MTTAGCSSGRLTKGNTRKAFGRNTISAPTPIASKCWTTFCALGRRHHPPCSGGVQMGPMEAPASLQMGQSPGTQWYHAHKHGSTAINGANGMTGAFIIEGRYDDELNAFYGP